ncbi:CRNN protein, partial [Corythaeola cristata]|nr:CRNN protein [Corythaeola cristata]
MAQLQENLNGFIVAFYTCARSDGNCSPLSREELRELIEQEFEDAMENPQDPKTVKKVLCFLDDDSNCRVDFSELLSLVFRVAKACYKPLQKCQAPEDGQEPTAQEKTGREQPPELPAAERVSCNQQISRQGVNNQVQDNETQDPENHQIQECKTQEQDQDTRQTQEGEKPEQDEDTHQTQEDETSKQDKDTHQTQEGETPEQDKDTHQTQEGKTSEQDEGTHQSQEGETPEQDQETHQDDRTEAPEGDPERGEMPHIAIPEQGRNTHNAEEIEMPKQDPKTHQNQETEAPQQGPNHHQNPEMESAEQDLNYPSETRGKHPNNKTQVCKVTRQDPNPGKAQKPLPPQQGASPRWDPKPQGTCYDLAYHQLPESKVLEQEHSGAEAPSCPGQQESHHRRQPAIEQQLLQSLYQWPPQQ